MISSFRRATTLFALDVCSTILQKLIVPIHFRLFKSPYNTFYLYINR